MNELKTLKDLKEWACDGQVGDMIEASEFDDKIFYEKEVLKAEAVKWVKHCTYKANQKFADDLDIKFWCAKRIGLMEFFNLTEDDLK